MKQIPRTAGNLLHVFLRLQGARNWLTFTPHYSSIKNNLPSLQG